MVYGNPAFAHTGSSWGSSSSWNNTLLNGMYNTYGFNPGRAPWKEVLPYVQPASSKLTRVTP